MDVFGLDLISDLLQRSEVHLRRQTMRAVVEPTGLVARSNSRPCSAVTAGCAVGMLRMARRTGADPTMAYTGRIGSVRSRGRSPSKALMQNASIP
jgi:hypothetical protein